MTALPLCSNHFATIAFSNVTAIHLNLQYLVETAGNLDGLPFKLHDFGFRGSTSVEVGIL